MRRRATAKIEHVKDNWHTIEFIPGGYYRCRFINGKLREVRTGVKRNHVSDAMFEKLRARAEQAYDEYTI